jgi:23S rRNA pseudouridine955/2504/2580 synthase
MPLQKLIIEKNDAEQRLDRFLKKYLRKAPLSLVYKIIRTKLKVNGRRANEKTKLSEGDEIELHIDAEELAKFRREKKKGKNLASASGVKIVFENDDMLAVYKPKNMLTHGDKKEKKDTLANRVISYLIEKGEYVPRVEKTFSPAPVSRLDRNTEGLVLFAKNAETLRLLNKLSRERGAIEKKYLALCRGEIKEEQTISGYLVKDEKKNKVQIRAAGPASEAEGKYVETIVRPIKFADGATLAEISLVTGRSHQIRASLAHINHPVLGDTKYGDLKHGGKEKGGQALAAHKLSIPSLGIEIEAAVPERFLDPSSRKS